MEQSTIPQPSYYAIIPSPVRYCEDLKPNEKIIYGEITSLCNASGECWAKNEYFANLYNVSVETVSRWISKLANKGLIKVQMVHQNGTERVMRILDINLFQNGENCIDEKVKVGCEKDQEGVDKKIKAINRKNNYKYNNKTPYSPPKGDTSKVKKVFDYSSEEYRLAVALQSEIHKWNNSFENRTEPQLQKWAKTFELMILKDGHSAKKIYDLFCAIHQDGEERNGFLWRRNILSPDKLRKQLKDGKLDKYLQPQKKSNGFHIVEDRMTLEG